MGALYLIHYTPSRDDPQHLISEASGAYGGPVALAQRRRCVRGVEQPAEAPSANAVEPGAPLKIDNRL